MSSSRSGAAPCAGAPHSSTVACTACAAWLPRYSSAKSCPPVFSASGEVTSSIQLAALTPGLMAATPLRRRGERGEGRGGAHRGCGSVCVDDGWGWEWRPGLV